MRFEDQISVGARASVLHERSRSPHNGIKLPPPHFDQHVSDTPFLRAGLELSTHGRIGVSSEERQ